MTSLFTSEKFLSLYRYFIYANKFKSLFDVELGKEDIDLKNMFVGDYGVFMSFWYSSLYVVIEGYNENGLSDAKIDTLLNDKIKVDLIKRYRNGIFHYQQNYFDDRFINLISEEGTAIWIRLLHIEFSRFFIEYAKNYQSA
jgi:hypothetical protein